MGEVATSLADLESFFLVNRSTPLVFAGDGLNVTQRQDGSNPMLAWPWKESWSRPE